MILFMHMARPVYSDDKACRVLVRGIANTVDIYSKERDGLGQLEEGSWRREATEHQAPAPARPSHVLQPQ